MKTLIVYFSHPGENWMANGLEIIKVGNTEKAAKRIGAFIGADLFEVKPINAYPVGYRDCCAVAKNELHEKAMPEYEDNIDTSPYEVIILGFPIWYGTYPRCLAKFIADHDLEKKTVLAFATQEGSGLGKSIKDLKEALPTSDVRPGLAIDGHKATASDHIIKAWLKENQVC